MDTDFIIAILIFFIIDFFGGVGKFIGLFAALGEDFKERQKDKIGRALYVDGAGNIVGGLLGASSLAVFVSSAVGVNVGGRTGQTAIFCAIFMLASFAFIPLVGAIPVQATSGILVFVGFILLPFDRILRFDREFTRFDLAIGIISGLVAFITYGIDKAILVVFVVYSVKKVFSGIRRSDIILLVTTSLLLVAVILQSIGLT